MIINCKVEKPDEVLITVEATMSLDIWKTIVNQLVNSKIFNARTQDFIYAVNDAINKIETVNLSNLND